MPAISFALADTLSADTRANSASRSALSVANSAACFSLKAISSAVKGRSITSPVVQLTSTAVSVVSYFSLTGGYSVK